MKKKILNPENFDELRNYVIGLFPEKLAPMSVVGDIQNQELEALSRTIGSKRFYFVVDMRTFEITKVEGVQRWLGYSDKEFSLKQYWKLVHPGLQKSVHSVFVQMAEILCSGRFKLEFMVQRYGSYIAIKHYNGDYLLLKRIASVFQYDKENRLTEYLNEFTILDIYNGEPHTPDFFTNKGEQELERGKIVMQQVLENFLGMKIFSFNELQVARILVYQPGITQKEIAAVLNKSPYTIDTYCKRFLEKARDYFHSDFPTVVDAAAYLFKNGLL